MTALASMTINTRLQLRDPLLPCLPNELGARWHSLDRPAAADALLDLSECRPVRDARQVAQDQLGHRDSFPGCADLQVAVELVGHVSYLDHLHGVHIISCVEHELKARTRLSEVRAGVWRAGRARAAPGGRRSARPPAVAAPVE